MRPPAISLGLKPTDKETLKVVKRLTSGLSGAMSSGNLMSYIEEAENFRRES